MEAWLKILLAFGLLITSLGFLYRPNWVLRWNAWARDLVFNDRYVLLYRRRWGLLFFLGAVLFFYSGFANLAYLHASRRPSSYLAMMDAYKAFRERHYRGVVTRCQEILKRDGDNIHAWALLGASWSALGRKDQARRAWEQVLKRDPDHPAGKSRLFQPAAPADLAKP
jgi:tetratricopeptide (TPR) repeat protein